MQELYQPQILLQKTHEWISSASDRIQSHALPFLKSARRMSEQAKIHYSLSVSQFDPKTTPLDGILTPVLIEVIYRTSRDVISAFFEARRV